MGTDERRKEYVLAPGFCRASILADRFIFTRWRIQPAGLPTNAVGTNTVKGIPRDSISGIAVSAREANASSNVTATELTPLELFL